MMCARVHSVPFWPGMSCKLKHKAAWPQLCTYEYKQHTARCQLPEAYLLELLVLLHSLWSWNQTECDSSVDSAAAEKVSA